MTTHKIDQAKFDSTVDHLRELNRTAARPPLTEADAQFAEDHMRAALGIPKIKKVQVAGGLLLRKVGANLPSGVTMANRERLSPEGVEYFNADGAKAVLPPHEAEVQIGGTWFAVA